jgi:hypothetical protein
VGGKGGLGKVVTERQYSASLSIANVLTHIITSVGEVAGTLPTTRVPNWSRANGTAGQAIAAVADALNVNWYVGRDGATNIANRAATAVTTAAALISRDIDCEIYSVSDCSLLPGASYNGKVIYSLRWQFNANKLVATVYYSQQYSLPDISQYYAHTHSAKVQSQNSDGSLELIVDGRFSMGRVPLLTGIPTSKIVMVAGDVVTVGFYEGDPRKPYALCTQQAGSGKGVARIDDATDNGEFYIQSVPGSGAALAALFWKPPGSTTWTAIATGPAPPTPGQPGVATPGRIAEGSDRVLL